MFSFSKHEGKMTVKQDMIFLGVGIMAIAMAIMGIKILFSIKPISDYDTVMDYVGLIFILFWIILVLSFGVYAFDANSQTITIDNDGILCKSWFRTRYTKWVDVKDWGLSYCGKTRVVGNTYYLYYSEHECVAKNVCRKKLKGKMIKATISGTDYFKAVSGIIPFCKTKTKVTPFIGEDRIHIMF